MNTPPSFWKKLRTYFREYSSSTSIHGFRYFGEKRPYFEKLWWFTAFTACLLSCAYAIILVYEKWDESPVIVTFGTAPYGVHEIPFPSVTVCSQARIKKKLYDQLMSEKLLKSYKEGVLTSEYDDILSVVSSVCPTATRRFNSSSFESVDSEKFYDILEAITPRFRLEECIFLKHRRSCSKLFTKIVTDLGICYSFNILDADELYTSEMDHTQVFLKHNRTSKNWTLDDGYVTNSDESTYPERTMHAGAQFSLQFQLNISSDEVFRNALCGDSVSGFVALLHIPIRVPRLTHHFIRIPLDSSVLAAIEPATMKTAPSVERYKAELRHCYFPKERKLEFFQYYSQNNCEIECHTKKVREACGCVEYYMPRKAVLRRVERMGYSNNETAICNGDHVKCKEDAEKKMLASKVQNSKQKDDCNCLPLCTDITYRSSISQASWAPVKEAENIENNFDYYDDEYEEEYEDNEEEDDDSDQMLEQLMCSIYSICTSTKNDSEGNISTSTPIIRLTSLSSDIDEDLFEATTTANKSTSVAQIRIYFTSADFIGSQRVALYGPIDFLANFGGLISLFTGFSILSLIEIIYFLTLRWISNRRIYGQFHGPS